MPVPRIVSASPVATWLACSEIVSTPKASAASEPASTPARTASPRPPRGARADEPRPLHAEVEDARALGDELPERGEHQRDRGGDGAGDERVDRVHGPATRARRRADGGGSSRAPRSRGGT